MLDNKLVDELRRVNKDSVDNLEKFHAAYSPFLHPNHAFLSQLKQCSEGPVSAQLQAALAAGLLKDCAQRLLRVACEASQWYLHVQQGALAACLVWVMSSDRRRGGVPRMRH